MKLLRKPFRRRTRILILCLLVVSVFLPICILSQRLKHLHSDASKGYVEDLSVLKRRTDAQKQNAVEENGSEEPEEAGPNVFKYKKSKLAAGISSQKEINSSNYYQGAVGSINLLDQKGSNNKFEEKGHLSWEKSSTYVPKNQFFPNTLHCDESKQPQSLKSTKGQVQLCKERIIQAKAYLRLAPPDSNSHLLKELKLRIKELEGAIGETKKDSHLSKRAIQKLKAMDFTLLKADRMFSDCTPMVKNLHTMTSNAEDQIIKQRSEIEFLMELAGRRTTPKGLHCLSMRLTNEYFSMRSEERELPNEDRVKDPHFFHFAILSDNVLACSVVVNSTVSAAMDPGKIVFHIVTDSTNLPAMSMWFLLNPPGKATIQVQTIDDFKWLSSKYDLVTRMQDYLDPIYTSELDHLRFYLPDLFPFLDKIVLLDHDVVVQRDLTGLWSIDMEGKVNGAVETCHEGEPSFHNMELYASSLRPGAEKLVNFSNCTWTFGLNVFDLQAWRRWNLTEVYHKYLNLMMQGKERPVLRASSLPIALMTFNTHTIALEGRWHILGLGHACDVKTSDIEQGAVIQFDGMLKPWLDIGLDKYKQHWRSHVMYDHPFLQQCNIHG